MTNIFKELQDFDVQSREILMGYKDPFLDLTGMPNAGSSSLPLKNSANIFSGETIRGMKDVSPLATVKFFNQTSDEIFSKYFLAGKDTRKGNTTIIEDINLVVKGGFKFNVHDFYFDQNNNGIKDADEQLIFKLLIFVSTDGNKVKECYDVVNPAADEIILFLETEQDGLSNQKLYGKVSEKVRKTYVDTATGKLYRTFFEGNIIDTVQKYLSQANKEIIEDLLIRGYVEDREITAGFLSGFKNVLLATSAPTKALGWVMNKLGNGIDFLKISDEYWDTESEGYYFSKDNIIENLSISTDKLNLLKNLFTDKKGFNLADLTPKMLDDIILRQISVIESFVGKYNSYVETKVEEIFKTLENPAMREQTESLAEKIALICGIWNGLVDFVSSVFKFLGMLLEAPFDVSKDFQHTLEMIDNFWEMSRNGTLWANLETAMSVGMTKMVEYLKSKNVDDVNWVRIYYIGGFSISFIATFFIPIVNLAKVANAGKVGEILAKINTEIGKTISQSTKFVKIQTAEAYQKTSRALQKLLEMFAKGGKKLQNFVDDIWKKIADWFLKNSKLLRKIANVADETDLLKLAKINRMKILAEEIQTIIKLTGGRKDLAEGILLSLKEVIEGKSVLQLVRRFGITEVPLVNSLSNYQARIWYTWRKMQIEKIISKIPNLEDKAKKAFELRNEFRTTTRRYMKDRKLANYLEIAEKNQEWDSFVTFLKEEKKLSGNNLWEYIIRKSQFGRDEVDKLFKIEK